MSSTQKVKKRRGRKPSKKNVKKIKQTNNPESKILHLPISDECLDVILNKNSLKNNDPEPYDPNNGFPSFQQVEKVQNNEQKEDNFIIIQDSNEKNIGPDTEVKENNKYIKKKLKTIMYEFLDSNSRKSWPIKVNVRCMWCCHEFNNIPLAIPERYINEKFFVSGNFCSINCAAAHIFNSNDVPGDKWERYSLLNLLSKKLGLEDGKIELAPPRETLKIFGGFYDIDEFRCASTSCRKTYNIINPPMISIVPKIEENIINYKLRDTDSFIPLNKELVRKAGDSLKIKRRKERTNTLKKYMNLQIE